MGRRAARQRAIVAAMALCCVLTGGPALALPTEEAKGPLSETPALDCAQDALEVQDARNDEAGVPDAVELLEEDPGIEVVAGDSTSEAVAPQGEDAIAGQAPLVTQGSKKAEKDAALSACAHVQSVGWQPVRHGAEVTLGTTGRGLRMEALKIDRPSLGLTGSVVYRAHVQGIGWQESVKDGGLAGTSGRGLRIEALRIKLTGQLGRAYDVWYRLHVQNLGWLAWASDWELSGTQGLSLRVEAAQVALVPAGQGAPAAVGQGADMAFAKSFKATYRVMVGGTWESWRATASAGKGSGPAVNAVCASLPTSAPAGIEYAAHLSGSGWTGYVGGGNPAGSARTTVEAVRMRIRGVGARVASVWYRVHVRGVGWTQWAHDDGVAGSVGKGWPISALQVRIVPKRASAPSNEKAAVPYESLDPNSPQMLRSANARQKRLRSAASSTPWPGASLCAAWVQRVYANAGHAYVWGNADDLYYRYCASANLQDLKVGMIVAVSTHTQSEAGKRWGHVGIYVGNGWVMHSTNAGVFRVSLPYWLQRYGTTVAPRWGWLGNAHVA